MHAAPAPHRHVVTEERLGAYHAACGLRAGADHAFPLYLAAVTLPAVIAVAQAAVPPSRHAGGLHAGHRIFVDRPVRPGMTLETHHTWSIQTTSAGPLVTVWSVGRASGQAVARQEAAFLFRDTLTTPIRPAVPAGAPAGTAVLFPAGTAQAYAEAAGDRQPIHLDDAAAQAAGFPRAIAHGLCVLAFAAAAVARARGGEPHDVVALGARFAGAVCWDEVVRVRTEEDDAFTATTEDGRPVLTHGTVSLTV